MPFRYFFFSMLMIGFLQPNSSAQDLSNDFKTSSISIFKNKTAFYIKSGKVKTTDGRYRMTESIPAARFGTFWVLSPDDNIRHLSSYTDTLSEIKEVKVKSVASLLRANMGQTATIVLEGRKYTGTIEGPEKPDEKTLDPMINFVVLRTSGEQWAHLKTPDIQDVILNGKPLLSLEEETRKPQPVVEIDFDKKRPEEPLDLMYLTGNIGWTPLYLVKLLSEKEAELTLRAEMSNSSEDIDDATVNFVVGVPNFRFSNQLSALVQIFGNNRDNFRHLASPTFGNVSSFQNQAPAYEIDIPAPIDGVPFDNSTEGSAQEDLYFYTLHNISLPKGGHGQYELLNNKVAIEHVYECALPKTNENFYRNQSSASLLADPGKVNMVVHGIKINNNTTSPFTTGSALVVTNESKPISQDQLNYTPVGGHSFLKLTESPDVQVKHKEKVVRTEENAKSVKQGGRTYHYDKITVEGVVNIRNFKNKDIALNVRRTITGHLEDSTIQWLKADRIQSSHLLNPMTDVCWETGVKAGGELEVKYTYWIFAHR